MNDDLLAHKLPDEAFWASEDRSRDPMGRMMLGRHRGVLVDAPTRVDLALHDRLPAGLYHLGAIREMPFVTLARHAALTAIDVGRNRLYVQPGSALVQDDDLEEKVPVDPARLPEGDMCSTQSVDLRALFGLPWAPARYLVTVLLRGEASNRVAVELVGSVAAGAAPGASDEASAVAASPAAGADDLGAVPAGPAPADSPLAIPQAPGVALHLPRVVRPREVTSWPLTVALRLPHDEPARHLHLVVLGADGHHVDQLTVSLDGVAVAQGAVCGRFVVDLSRHLRLPQAQTYFVRAFVGAWMSESVASALVVDDEP